jgi:hypothetical protein
MSAILFFSIPVSGQSRSVVFGIDGGYMFPLGEWNKHRYAEGVNQLQGGIALNGDMEFGIRRIGIAMNGGYSNLSVAEWEKYAGSQGEELDASAYALYFGILLKIYLYERPPNTFNLEFGLNYFSLTGQETFTGKTYEYDFLNSRFGFIAGMGYERFLNKQISFTVRLKGLFVPNGIQYADGEKQTIIGLQATSGFRFYL